MKRNYWKYALVTLMCTGSLYALPPQVEADSLALEAKTAIDSRNYSLAVESLDKLGKIKVPLPESYEYYYGVALRGVSKYKQAMDMFEAYLNKGSATKFYKDALENYNYCKSQYTRLKEQYEKEIKNYPNKLHEYEQKQKDLEDCGATNLRRWNFWLKKCSGFFSNCNPEKEYYAMKEDCSKYDMSYPEKPIEPKEIK